MSEQKKPFIEHLHELRRRLFYCAGALFVGAVLGYVLQATLLKLLVKPLGQQLYYSNPTGGFSFFFNICLLFGALVAIPVLVYNIVKFVTPALSQHTQTSVALTVLMSVLLAATGVAFAYLFSLPAALHFLASFGGGKVQPLIFAGEYLRFVIIYLLSFAVLFQVPVVVGFMNHIKPLKPGGMMGFQRYVILGSFILAAIITPTPDPINQFIMAAPMIVLYQLSIGYVWLVNRDRRWTEPIGELAIPSWLDFEEPTEAHLAPQTVFWQQPADVEVKPLAGAPVSVPINVMSQLSVDGLRPTPRHATETIRPRQAASYQPRQNRTRIIDDIVSSRRPMLVQ